MPFLAFEVPPPTSKSTGSTIAPVTSLLPVEHTQEETAPNVYPVLKLDADMITDATAGRLSTSMLGHVLFLKNQVPFPVLQLGRIPSGKTNARALKLRTELLNSFDTISSHLDTTFSALSTALARSSCHTQRSVAQAFLAFLVGPSIGTAKSRLILGIDGLETRIWGTREGKSSQNAGDTDSQDSDDDEEEEGGSEDDEESDNGSVGSGKEPEDSEEEESSENEDTSDGSEIEEGQQPSPPHVSYAEEQKFLHNADRSLSRTLAAADADGKGITSEMTPSQTHVLIRAPRRFAHPAWVPRQNVTTSLEAVLDDFLSGSGMKGSDPGVNVNNKSNRKQKVEGVWITPRSGIDSRRFLEQASNPSRGETLPTGQGEDEEMIWWSWDGKLVGFADW